MATTAPTTEEPISAAPIKVVALCALVTLIEGIDLTLTPLLGPRITQAWSIPGVAAVYAAVACQYGAARLDRACGGELRWNGNVARIE